MLQIANIMILLCVYALQKQMTINISYNFPTWKAPAVQSNESRVHLGHLTKKCFIINDHFLSKDFKKVVSIAERFKHCIILKSKIKEQCFLH